MDATPTTQPKQKLKSLPGQFSLRFLLVAMLLVSLGLVWLTRHRQIAAEEAQAIQELQAIGDIRHYYDSNNGVPRGPKWLRNILGDLAFSRVQGVAFYETGELKDFEKLRIFKRLKWVTVLNTDSQLTSLNGLEGKTSLQELSIIYCDKLNDITTLETLTGLTSLSAHFNSESEMKLLTNLKKLEKLELSFGNSVRTLRAIPPLENVTQIWLEEGRLYTLDGIQDLPNLETIELGYFDELINADAISQIENAPNLKELNLFGESKIESYAFLARLTGLESLTVRASPECDVASYIRGLKNLTYLGLYNGKNHPNLDYLADLQKLTRLEIGFNHGLSNLDALLKLPKLRRVVFDQCKNLHNETIEEFKTERPRVQVLN